VNASLGSVAKGIYLVNVPSDHTRLEERVVEHRERIRTLEGEVVRLRDRQHSFAETIAVVHHLADAVEHQGERIEELARAVVQSSKRALERPSAGVVAQYLALVVAIVAIVVTFARTG
jgi:hypothetical protein